MSRRQLACYRRFPLLERGLHGDVREAASSRAPKTVAPPSVADANGVGEITRRARSWSVSSVRSDSHWTCGQDEGPQVGGRRAHVHASSAKLARPSDASRDRGPRRLIIVTDDGVGGVDAPRGSGLTGSPTVWVWAAECGEFIRSAQRDRRFVSRDRSVLREGLSSPGGMPTVGIVHRGQLGLASRSNALNTSQPFGQASWRRQVGNRGLYIWFVVPLHAHRRRKLCSKSTRSVTPGTCQSSM